MVLQGSSWKAKRKSSEIILRDFKGRRYAEVQQNWSKSDREKISLMSRSWKGNKREKYVLLFMVTCTHTVQETAILSSKWMYCYAQNVGIHS